MLSQLSCAIVGNTSSELALSRLNAFFAVNAFFAFNLEAAGIGSWGVPVSALACCELVLLAGRVKSWILEGLVAWCLLWVDKCPKWCPCGLVNGS